MMEEVRPSTPPNDFLFLAGRFWGRDEVARTGFFGVVLKFASYAYVAVSSLFILYDYLNTRQFTVWTVLLALGGLSAATHSYIGCNKRRDSDREILKALGIIVERKEKSICPLTRFWIKLCLKAPPAIMTLSRGDTPFLSIDQDLASSVPTVRLLVDNASIQKEQQPSLASQA